MIFKWFLFLNFEGLEGLLRLARDGQVDAHLANVLPEDGVGHVDGVEVLDFAQSLDHVIGLLRVLEESFGGLQGARNGDVALAKSGPVEVHQGRLLDLPLELAQEGLQVVVVLALRHGVRQGVLAPAPAGRLLLSLQVDQVEVLLDLVAEQLVGPFRQLPLLDLLRPIIELVQLQHLRLEVIFVFLVLLPFIQQLGDFEEVDVLRLIEEDAHVLLGPVTSFSSFALALDLLGVRVAFFLQSVIVNPLENVERLQRRTLVLTRGDD